MEGDNYSKPCFLLFGRPQIKGLPLHALEQERRDPRTPFLKQIYLYSLKSFRRRGLHLIWLVDTFVVNTTISHICGLQYRCVTRTHTLIIHQSCK